MIKSWTIALVALFAGTAQSAIIDFEGYAAGTIIDNEYQVSHGVTIQGVNLDENAQNIAVVFDTDNVTGGDDDLGAAFKKAAEQDFFPGNVLIIHEHPEECGDFTSSCGNDPDDEGSWKAGYFDIVFSQAVTLNSIDFFDIEHSEATEPQFEIEFFSDNAFQTALMDESFFVPDTGGDNTWERAVFALEGVKSMRINLGGSGAIDNIDFTVNVSEPSMWFLFSVLTLGLVNRRQRA